MLSIEQQLIERVRAFVDECNIENYGSQGEMAGEAEYHRIKMKDLLNQLDSEPTKG